MKRLVASLFCFFLLLACSNPVTEPAKEDIDQPELIESGIWHSMTLDKSKLEYVREGGIDSISVTNYTSWWICGGYYIKRDENGISSQDGKYIPRNSSDSLDASWFRAVVPHKGGSNKVIVTVDPNNSGKNREAIIEMTAGDIFADILIYQQ